MNPTRPLHRPLNRARDVRQVLGLMLLNLCGRPGRLYADQPPPLERRRQSMNGEAAASRVADDPDVQILCREAVALAMAEPERARSFIRRARVAGWFPEMHFRVYRRFARTEGLTYADIGTGMVAPVDITAIDDFRYEWRASWDLSRMVFNPDELQAHLEALRIADVRRDIQTLVIKLYFERRRLLSEPDTGGDSAIADLTKVEKRALRVAEIEAELDAMSGGAFSQGPANRRQAAPAP